MEAMMTMQARWIPIALACGAVLACNSAPATEHAAAARSGVIFSHALPAMDGAHLTVKVVEVNLKPGEASAPHSHPCAVVGYVLEGAFRNRVKGEPEATYRAGESFYEPPNSLHIVSANASTEKPVRFLASFTCDHEAPLLIPVPDTAAFTGK
jgi:quercetin dioxygenase-like cupin family protein